MVLGFSRHPWPARRRLRWLRVPKWSAACVQRGGVDISGGQSVGSSDVHPLTWLARLPVSKPGCDGIWPCRLGGMLRGVVHGDPCQTGQLSLSCFAIPVEWQSTKSPTASGVAVQTSEVTRCETCGVALETAHAIHEQRNKGSETTDLIPCAAAHRTAGKAGEETTIFSTKWPLSHMRAAILLPRTCC